MRRKKPLKKNLPRRKRKKKDKFVRGLFVDLARGESQNYGFSPLTHWLSYLAHLLFGLSIWAWHIPFFALNLLSWCCLSAFISRRVGALSSLWYISSSCLRSLRGRRQTFIFARF